MFLYVEACGCNNACRHCWAEGAPPYGGFYSLAELRELREEWGPLFPYHESSAHPEFPEIVARDLVADDSTVLPTNGFGLARRDDYREVFQRLRDLGWGMVSLTLHGLSRYHDWFVGSEGAFETILTASRRALECGVGVHWNIYLDRANLEEVPGLVESGKREFGVTPWIGVPHHTVSDRLWQYERLRPSLQDLQQRLRRGLVDSPSHLPLEQRPPEELTEASHFRAWEENPEAKEFALDEWPPKPPFERLRVVLTRDRRVLLHLGYAAPFAVGRIDEGRDRILERVVSLPAAPGYAMQPADTVLPPGDQALIHPDGCSLRLKAIAATLRSQSG